MRFQQIVVFTLGDAVNRFVMSIYSSEVVEFPLNVWCTFGRTNYTSNKLPDVLPSNSPCYLELMLLYIPQNFTSCCETSSHSVRGRKKALSTLKVNIFLVFEFPCKQPPTRNCQIESICFSFM